MARRRTIGESRPIIVDRIIDDLDLELDDEIEDEELELEDEEPFDIDDEDAASVWASSDDDEAWCDCVPWIDDELRSALWWNVYKNIRKRRRMH
jgi:hypothetical protein